MARVQLGRPSSALIFHCTNFVGPMTGFSDFIRLTGWRAHEIPDAFSLFHTESVQ